MTNKEWFNNTAIIDKLIIMLRHTTGCPLYLLGQNYSSARCDKFSVVNDPDMSKTCYSCMCAWLNEEHITE